MNGLLAQLRCRISPLQGFGFFLTFPGALPRAVSFRPFRASKHTRLIFRSNTSRKHHHFSIRLCACVITLTLTGCRYNPELKTREWEEIRIAYLTRENDKLEPQIWFNRDPELLARLRAAFPSEGEYRMHSKPHRSRVNRVDIKLSGGQWWCLAYFPTSGNIGIDDPFHAKRTFILKDSNPEAFYVTLTNEIMRTYGVPIDLNTKIRSREEANELGDNDASDYMRMHYR